MAIPFVGRGHALAALEHTWARTREHAPQRVLVEGPAGIGKSALVRRFLTGVPHVRYAEGEEAEEGDGAAPPYGVVQQWLGRTGRWADPADAGGALLEALEEPGVLVLDDAQWADRPSLAALAFAVRRLRADRVLALAVVRDADDPRLPAGLRRLFTADTAVRIRLDGLAADELRELAATAGLPPLTARAATRLRTHTGGSPLHALALLEQEGQALVRALEQPDVAPPAPRSFTALVLARLARCTAPAEALVCAAAVLGAHAPLERAAALAGLADPLDALEEAVYAGLLTERPGEPHVRFPHPLTHAAVYHRLGPSRRSALHRAAAALAPDTDTALRHRALAATGPDPGLAAELAALARELAADGRWEAAAARFAAAARLSGTRTLAERRCLEAVECQVLAGDVPDTAEAAARVAGFAESGWRSYLLGRLCLFDAPRAEALLTDAWRRCDPATEPVLGARVAGQFAALYGSTARGGEMAEWAGRALELAPADTATDMIHYLALAGRAMEGRAAEALAGLGPLPDPAVAAPDDLERLLGRGSLREYTGDLAGAVRDLTGVHAHCRGRAASFRVLAGNALASAEYRAGHWDDAVVHAEQALSLAADTDQPHIGLYCRALACLAHSARGAFARAQAHAHVVRQFAGRGHVQPEYWAALAEGHLARARGRPEEVVLALEPLLALRPRGTFERPGALPWADLLADAWSALEEPVRAEEALGPYERAAREARHPGARLAAGRARGTLEAALGEPDRAERAFRDALGHAPRVAAPFDRALLHLAYGRFLRRAGRRARAGEELTAARALLVRLGARPDLERCERELAACGLHPGAAHERGTARLTPQELAVARLVGAGLTNRQAARELVISVKTVEYHLGRIFTKLGVDSRTRLAALLADPAA
ncbi:AAA family ATPase [Streptomyces sp. NPDC001941]|uniref:AAA family ATPase n=1 Tax=Streptomyces sp. NPDC001941 TaxID=3154659 RepID=UPI00332BF648